MGKTFCITPVVLLAFAAAGMAQTAVPPPPKPADSGPSLAVTLQFIQEKVNSIGAVNWNAFAATSEAPHRTSVEVTIPSIDPSSCTMSYRYQEPPTSAGYTETLAFADVEDVTVGPWEQYIDRVNAAANVASTQPPTLYLAFNRPNKKGHMGLFFQDASLADRVAKAITHAVELCGGGNKEPF